MPKIIANKIRKTKSKLKSKTKKRKLIKKLFKPKSKSYSAYSNVMELFLAILNIIKLFHWKTKKYAEHISADQYYEDMQKTSDTFIEVYMTKPIHLQHKITQKIAKFSRIDEDETETNNIKNRLFEFREFLIDLDDCLEKNEDNDLLNLRDELLVHLQQFLYRLTLN